MDQELKQIEELLADESFLKYCGGDEKEKLYWEKHLQENQALNKHAEQARKLYELVKAELADVPGEVERFRSFFQQHIAINDESYENQPAVIQMPAHNRRWIWAAAAAIIFILGAGSYFLLLNKAPQEIAKTEKKNGPLKNDVAPGGNKAVLTLADGSAIILDSVQNGALAKQGNVKVIKLNNGQLAYNTSNGQSAEVLYNTVSTPKGGQYKITLSDGTQVWLNAASSIRYPAAFVGKERKVEITGEAYFEVVKNPSLPFIVKVNTPSGDAGEVEVLGTHFNINSYADEETVNTTLLEGSVKVSGADKSILLSPGEQSQLKPGSSLQVVKGINIDEAVAWKEGFFHFESAGLSTILRQFSRWYDIDIVYEGKLKQRKFFGIVSRASTLMNVLKMLKANDINFRVEGKKLIVRSE